MRRLNLTSTTRQDGTKETKGNKPDQTSVTTIKSECKEQMNSVGETGGKITKRQHSRSNSHSGSDTYVFAKPPAKPLSADTNRRKISSNSNDSDTFIVYNDEAINVSNVYGGKDKNKGDNCQRLLIISSKVRNSSVIRHALLSNVIYVQYNYEVHSIDEILVFIEESIGTKKVASVAMVLSCNQSAIQITAKDDKTLCGDKIHDLSIKLFFTRLIELCIDKSHPGHRLDLLALSAYQQLDIPLLTHELQDWTGVTVGFAKDFVGNDIGNFKKDDSKSVVGDMYFRLEKLRFWSGRHQQSLAGFEKIRTVGKGAYGAAVLYKKKDDDSVVILKEINMHDLSAAERHLALNEVNVLAMLDHPNIISYYDSFEEDGVLMIEMEYADGGTLKQFLYQQEQTNLDEKVVLEMFQQIVAAIRYIHEHKILHRDLKTDNIFLTKEGIIKVGDFGISKMMSSAQGANTVLGTPYYISPEMCEGKPYSFKSDIWALGCILYEMACLQKTFEGTNLPALVNKIMKGQFAPVKDIYSPDFRGLVLDMLQNDPDKRPDATELMYHRLPPLIAKYHEEVSDPEEELNENENANKKIKMRSVMYYLEASTGELTCITDLPPRLKIKNAAVGPDHVIVVTTEEQVYSWGEGSKGQLGHGNTESKGRPELIEALNGKSIVAAQCGDGFSLFRSENGLVLTCGDGSKGCLGHGDWSDTFKPRLIEALLSVDVSSVTCGPNHVVGVSSTGEVYTWGQGSDGKLGLGDDENYCQPMLVTIDEPVISVDVRCGNDGTMILTDIGSVFACGSNENNKLGLNNRQGFLMAMKNIFNKTEVEGRNVLTPVRSLARHRVIDISMGAYHSAVIVESGHVYMFGRNSEGQLATGNIKPSNTIVEVKALHDKCINKVVCGEHFTVASTKDHELYYWGLRYTVPSSLDDSTTSRSSTNGSLSNTSNITGKDDIKLEDVTSRKTSGKSGHHRHSSSASVSSVTGTESLTQTTSQDSGIVLNKESTEITGQISGESQSPADSGAPSTCDSSSGFRPLSSVPHRSLSAGSRENVKDKEKDSNKDESVILLEPKELIRIKQVNEKVLLGNIFIHGENLFVQVETTAPPPRRKALKKRSLRRRLNVGADGTREVSASSREGGDEYSSEASEIDSQGSIPAWLRQELINCNDEDSNDVYEADDTSDQSSGDETRKAIIDSSMSSIQVNKDLSPVKSPSKRRGKFEETQKFLRTPREVVTKDTNTRNRTLSNNSTAESGADGLVYDSSSSEPIQGKITPRNAILKVSTVTTRKTSASSLVKPKSVQSVKSSAKIKSHGKGKGKGFDADIKEQLEARGFVSDVTVKRREEALLGELEVMKEERAKAERLIQEMEGEQQLRLEQMKKEAQKHVEEREKGLQNEVENLRKQLEYQSSLLHSNQLTVQQLQEQLNRLQIDASSNTSTPRNSDATSSLSHKSSKVCSVQ